MLACETPPTRLCGTMRMQADLAQQVQDKARRTQPGDLNGLLEQALIVSSKPDPALVKMQRRQQQAEYRRAASTDSQKP